MGTVFGADQARAAAAQRSFQNISTGRLTFAVGQQSYTLATLQTVSIAAAAAAGSSDIQNLLASNQLRELVVHGAFAAPTPIAAPTPTDGGAGVSFTAATQSALTGNFDGVGIDPASGHWVLDDGNRLIYPNSRIRRQPAAGLTSAVTIGATMQRLGLQGSVGFALYSDATTTAKSFANGLLVMYESGGRCEIYRLQNGLLNAIVDRTSQLSYPFDLDEHTYAVVLEYPDSTHLNIYAYVDGTTVSQTTVTNGIPLNGTIGFATAHGCSPVLIVPNSFEFTLGIDTHETSSGPIKQIISREAQLNLAPGGGVSGTVGQTNLDPQVVTGAVTGTGVNTIPDSDWKFGAAYWVTSNAGTMQIVAGAGASGGKGIVLANNTASAVLTGNVNMPTDPMGPFPANAELTISGNILATGTVTGGTGLPAWEIWDSTMTTRIASATQALGMPLNPTDATRRVQQTFTLPNGITTIVAVPAANNVQLGPHSQIVWSEPKLQTGPYATAYSPGLFSASATTIPLAISDPAITTVIIPDGSGGGLVQLSQAAPNSIAPYSVMPGQVTSIASQTPNAAGSYLQGQSVAGSSVIPGAISNTTAASAVYDNTTVNMYNGLGTAYWYLVGTGAVTSATVIPDGATLVYSVTTTDPAPTPSAAPETLQLAGNATINVIWNHPAFIGTSIGSTKVSFTGNSASTTSNISAVATLADSSTTSITSTQTTQTTTPAYTAAISNNGNPSITQSNVDNTVYNPASSAVNDAQTTGISGANNTSTSNQPFTNTLSASSSPQVVRVDTPHTAPTKQTAAVNNSSTTTITSATNPVPTTTAVSASGSNASTATITTTGTPYSTTSQKTGSGSYSGTATVTQNSSTTYANQQKASGNPGNSSDTPQIVVTPNTVYNLTQHNSGYLNNSGATASIVGTASYSAVQDINMSATASTGYEVDSDIVDNNQNVVGTSVSQYITGNAYQTGAVSAAATIYSDASHGISIAYSGLANSIQTKSGHAAYSYTTTDPVSQAQTVHNVPANWTYADHALTWTIILQDSNHNTLTSWSGITGSGTTSLWSGSYSGTVYIKILPVFTADTGNSTAPTILNSGGGFSINTWTASTSYANNASAWQTYGTYSGTVAPTSAATQLNFHISNIAYSSDSYGAAAIEIRIVKNDGSNTVVLDVSSPGANSDHTYYAGGETCTSWTVQMRAYITADNGNFGVGTHNYVPNVDGYFYWYQNDPSTTYSYSSNTPAAEVIATSSVALNASAGTPMTFSLTGVSCPTDANGNTYINVQLADPTGAVVFNQNYTGAATINVTTAGSGNGKWTWTARGGVARTGSPTSTVTYSVAWNGQCSWYESVGTTTYTYPTTNGTSSGYATSSATLAPTSLAQAVGFSVSSVTAPRDAAGTSYLTVQLKNPSGTFVTSGLQYSTDSGSTWTNCGSGGGGTGNGAQAGIFASAILYRYYAAGAAAGVYTWVAFAYVQPNNSGSGSYAVSATLQPSWYETSSGTTYSYVAANGPTGSYTTSASTLAPTGSSTQLSIALSNIVQPSDTVGKSQYVVELWSPTSTKLQSWTVGFSQTSATFTYAASGAAAGQYTWKTYASAVPNNAGTTNGSYADTANYNLTWYETHNVNQTTYTSNNGPSATYQTTTATLAPTSAAQQLALEISAITVGSDSYGSSAYTVTLSNPSGTQVQSWNVTSPQTLSWSNSSAAAGQYTWTIYAYCTNTATGTSSYADSLTAQQSWYESITTYTTAYSTSAGAATTAASSSTTVAPTSSSTQLSLSISNLVAASDPNGSSSWTITLTDPNANQVKTWTGITTAQTLTWFGASAIAGVYTWSAAAVAAISGSPSATSTYSDTLTATNQWYQSVTTTTTNYSTYPGKAASYTTPSGTAAPVNSQTQLTLSFTALTLPSSSAGSTAYSVTLSNSNNTVVGSWAVTNLSQSPLSYSAAGAAGGVYTWTLQANSTLSSTPAAVDWSTALTGSLGWYTAQVQTATVYVNNASTSISTAQTDPTLTLAPTSSSLAITLTPSSLTLPSGAAGATQYQAVLKDPTGTTVNTWTITNTNPISWWQAGAKSGQYTWSLQALCTNTGTATANFSTAFSGTIGWHQSLTQQVPSYTSHDGSAARYQTPANTAAPAGSGTQLVLTLSSVIVPSDSAGSSSITVQLFDPNNNAVAAAARNGIVGPTTITYSDPAAIAGIYTWVVYGRCATSGTPGASSYSVSWSGQHSWYQPAPSSQGVYVMANDGVTRRNSVADTDVSFTSLTPSQAAFKITNSASSALGFTLGVLSEGF